MMNLMSIVPPTPTPSPGHETFFALLSLVSDPAASKARLQEIFDACTAANTVIRAANDAQQQIDAARKEHDETLARQREDMDREIKQAKADLERDSSQAYDEIRRREKAVGVLETKAAEDADTAAKLRINLERRLDAIKSAAA